MNNGAAIHTQRPDPPLPYPGPAQTDRTTFKTARHAAADAFLLEMGALWFHRFPTQPILSADDDASVQHAKKVMKKVIFCLTQTVFCDKITFVDEQDLSMEKSPSLVEGARLEIV